ncbi:MAG: hypothetical protein ABRQ24_10555 [Syntrophomonadaceae bacterium]
MAAEEQGKKKAKDDKQKQILDFAEAWKKMYFESESTLAKAIDEYVAGDSFTSFLEKMGAEYLSLYKTSNQNMERFFANSPVPSKKDVARVAELVLNIEDKVDNLDMEVSASLNGLAVSMMRLVDFQAVLKDELISLRQEVQSVQRQLQIIQPTSAVKEEKTVVRTRSRKTSGEDLPEGSDNADTGNNPDSTVDKVPRTRNRKKKAD